MTDEKTAKEQEAEQRHRERITDNDDGSKTISLRKPITASGVTLEKLTMREPTVADQLTMAAAKGGVEGDKEVRLIGNLVGLSPQDMRLVPLYDFKTLQLAFLDFVD